MSGILKTKKTDVSLISLKNVFIIALSAIIAKAVYAPVCIPHVHASCIILILVHV